MSVEEELERVLERARRGLAPTVGDRARLSGKLAAAVGPAPLAPGFSALRRAAVVGALALGGGIGYWQGYRAASSVERAQPKVPVAVPLVLRGQPPLVVSPPARVVEDAPVPEVERPQARAPRVPSSPLAPPEPVPVTQESGLDAEVRELRRVEKSIRDGNPRLALVLLEELDRAIPQGQLLEERAAARVMGSCQLGAESAVAEARVFVAGHASSAYVARVKDICRLDEQRISEPSGTDVPR